jgi:hypothetical protein
VAPLDVLGLEVGYRLIPLVDKSQDGELLRRIRGIRKKFAQEVGFLVSPIHIRDNLELKPNTYRILLKGSKSVRARPLPANLAINPGRVAGAERANTKDPAFGLPAIWIDAGQRDQAQAYGYTVVDASTVVATHLNHLILTHAAELLGRQEVQQLLDHLAKEMPKLVEDLVPKVLPLGTLQKVLQGMLEEGVHIRDMRTIIETVADHATRTQNADDLGFRCVRLSAAPSCSNSSRVMAKCRSCRSTRRWSACCRRPWPEARKHQLRTGSGRYADARNGCCRCSARKAWACRRFCWCQAACGTLVPLPAADRSTTEGAVSQRSAGNSNYQGDLDHRR